jgi:hypothetical protein
VQSRFFEIYLFLLQNLVLKVTYLHYYVVLQHIIILLVDLNLGPISTPLLVVEIEILAPSWAIFGAPTHLISTPTWERCLVFDQT